MEFYKNTLYLLTDGIFARVDDGTIVIKNKEITVGRVPIRNISSIIVGARCGISSGLIRESGKSNISIVWLNNSGTIANSTLILHDAGVSLRILQHELYKNKDFCLNWSKTIIEQKLNNSITVLKNVDIASKRQENKIQNACTLLEEHIVNLQQTQTVQELLGVEGSAARAYYATYQELYTQEWWLGKRTRRPPEDPVNALLSFGYQRITAEASGALAACGLDPFIGYLHVIRAGRPALALDIIEPLRSILVDCFTLNLIKNEIYNLDDFSKGIGNDFQLNDEARRKWYDHWQLYKAQSFSKNQNGLLVHITAKELLEKMRLETRKIEHGSI